MRISTETSHFYIDLVFYNYLLKCFVITDLKTGKLSHDETIAKYSVIKENQPLFASKYQRILPTEEALIAEIDREKRLIEGSGVMG